MAAAKTDEAKPAEMPTGLMFRPMTHALWVRIVGQSGRMRRALNDDSGLDLWQETQAMYALLAKLVVSVPAAWLVEGAPDAPDWADPETFEYIERGAYNQLMGWLVDGEAKKKLVT